MTLWIEWSIIDGDPQPEVRLALGGVVASARGFGGFQTVDADTQTGMLVVLVPVPDHVRLVHNPPLVLGLLPIFVLSALSNERNALWPAHSHP